MGTRRTKFDVAALSTADARAIVIAEIGQNHNGSASEAARLVDAACWAGADAVKLTKRDLTCELSHEAANRRYASRHSFGATYGEHRAALELKPGDVASLVQRAHRHGMWCVGTGCDIPSLDLLLECGVDAVKIASRDAGNVPLLEHAVTVDAPVLLSSGMSDWEELDTAIETLAPIREQLVVMHCTSLYPTPVDGAHLRAISAVESRYGVVAGFSDHTEGTLLAPIAVAMGAKVVEKHLTLDRRHPGRDQAVSVEPDELCQMIDGIRLVEKAVGNDAKAVSDAVRNVRARIGRSLVTRVELKAGSRIDASALTLKCPGDGISWADRQRVVGRRVNRDLPANSKVDFQYLE